MSGSFVRELGGPHRRGPSFTPVVAFVEEFTAAPLSPGAGVYVCCGAYEALAADNRAFLGVLKATGARVHYDEPRDGHHWHAWRDRLGDALTFLLPGPDPGAASTVPG